VDTRSGVRELIRSRNASGGVTHADSLDVRASVRQVLDALTDGAAFVRNGSLDILAINEVGRVLFADALDSPRRPPNIARFIFTDPRAPRLYADWTGIARKTVGSLRWEAARARSDRLFGLIWELSERSDEFRMLWASHQVESRRSGVLPVRHPVTGVLTLSYNVFDLPGDPDQAMVVYTAEPDSFSHEALVGLRTRQYV
jgi:hypothetical protein